MARNDGATRGPRKGAPPRGEFKRRARGFRAAAEAAGGALKSAGAGRGFAEHRLLAVWEAAVGADLAARCAPVKVEFGRRDSGLGATLVVAADGASAIEIQHLAPTLLERVNQIYGYRAVGRLRISQSAQPPRAERFAPPPAPPPLDSAAVADISPTTEGVDDPRLRAALTRLGANILTAGARRRDGS